ncbi:MAG: hypothetical protein AAGD07_19330 [Planctomycetota bacterium]
MTRDKLENQIALQTDHGREALQVYWNALRSMTGEQRVAKAFELTAITRETMRAGIRDQNPDADDDSIQRLYVDRLLSLHGLSVAELRQKQAEEHECRRSSPRNQSQPGLQL